MSVAAGDALALKLLTRIGTNSDGTKCTGHANATGLRLYYDATSNPSGTAGELSAGAPQPFFLHSAGTSFFFDTTAPTSTSARSKDSTAIKFASGNVWKEIGTWSRTNP